MNMTIEKARQNSIAAATVFRQSHVGRVADYPIMAAQAGMIGMMTADSGRSSKSVAPFGGREAEAGHESHLHRHAERPRRPVLHRHGHRRRGRRQARGGHGAQCAHPGGWLLDRDGNQTTDPGALRQGGVMLPLGGPEGHKGYGLSAMVEIFSGILTGLGFGIDPSGRHNDGCFMAAFSVDAFRDLDDFKREVTEFAEYLTSTPPAEGFDRVYYPGELEHLRSAQKRRDGVEVEDATWGRLRALAEEYGVAGELGLE